MDAAESKEDIDNLQIGSSADFKIGQKYPTPAPANGDRVFYESLLEQNPNSEMAQDWCVSYGVLDASKAAQVYKKICQRKGKNGAPSPAKRASNSNSAPPAKKPVPSAGSRPRKAIIEDDFIEDTGLEKGSSWEGQGTSGI